MKRLKHTIFNDKTNKNETYIGTVEKCPHNEFYAYYGRVINLKDYWIEYYAHSEKELEDVFKYKVEYYYNMKQHLYMTKNYTLTSWFKYEFPSPSKIDETQSFKKLGPRFDDKELKSFTKNLIDSERRTWNKLKKAKKLTGIQELVLSIYKTWDSLKEHTKKRAWNTLMDKKLEEHNKKLFPVNGKMIYHDGFEAYAEYTKVLDRWSCIVLNNYKKDYIFLYNKTEKGLRSLLKDVLYFYDTIYLDDIASNYTYIEKNYVTGLRKRNKEFFTVKIKHYCLNVGDFITFDYKTFYKVYKKLENENYRIRLLESWPYVETKNHKYRVSFNAISGLTFKCVDNSKDYIFICVPNKNLNKFKSFNQLIEHIDSLIDSYFENGKDNVESDLVFLTSDLVYLI